MKLKLEVIFEVPAWSLERNTNMFDAIEKVLKEDEACQASSYLITKMAVEKLAL